MIPEVVVDWLEPWAQQFFFMKGFLGLFSTVLLVAHMAHTWDKVQTLAQRLRYYTLMYMSFLLTSASLEQIHDNAEVNWRNVGGLVGTVLLAAASIISIATDMREQETTQSLSDSDL